MAKGKIKKEKIHHGMSHIPEPKDIIPEYVRFSFKYLDLSNGKFDLPDTTQKVTYLSMLMDRLKRISSMTFAEFRQAGHALRSHQIRWGQTSEPEGYSHLPQQIQDCEPWQFSLAREELGRLHGFFLSDAFYVVWIDHEHRLYS